MTWDVTVVALVDAEETEKVRRRFGSCCATFALPKQCGQVIRFAQYRPFTHVVVLCYGVEVEQATC